MKKGQQQKNKERGERGVVIEEYESKKKKITEKKKKDAKKGLLVYGTHEGKRFHSMHSHPQTMAPGAGGALD